MVAYREGDATAFELLFERYEKRIYNYLLHKTRDPELAADLFQATFLKVHEERYKFDPRRRFAPWIFTIGTNLLRDEMRRRSYREKAQDPSLSGEADVPTPGDLLARRQLLERLSEAMRELPPAQSEVILLKRYGGFSYKEIAEITGQSEGAARQAAHRGFESLRKKLKEWFGQD